MATDIKLDQNGGDWLIDGLATHSGRTFRGHSIEGLLLNSRMANGIFDDANNSFDDPQDIADAHILA